MKLIGYYVSAIIKRDGVLKKVVAFDATKAADVKERTGCKVLDSERHKFALNLEPGDVTDAGILAARLALEYDEVC